MKKLLLVIFFAVLAITVATFAISGCGDEKSTTTDNADVQKQIDDVKGALPKFAIPMREVGDRFDNMYFAAKGGNWGLAAYMSKYMDKAMNPAKVTKPDEYAAWASFYSGTFDPVNKAIAAKDFDSFDKSYTAVINSCNACHESTGYKFIQIKKADAPADTHEDYNLMSEPTDVPK